MKQAIQLSLAGDRRVLVLTPETVRKAFFQFTRLNKLLGRNRHLFEWPHKPDISLLDVLHRSCWLNEDSYYLSQKDIQTLERQINHLLLQQGRVLVENEKKLYYGHLSVRGWGQNRKKVYYLVRYGIIFVLERLRRDAFVAGERRELWIESEERDFQFVYYDGIRTAQGRLVLQLSNRFDLSQTWTIPLADFKSRRLFSVRQVIPCEGFSLCLLKFSKCRVRPTHLQHRHRT
ncbi:hypothetical protein PN36_22790 [Candidatus Thiomargarita nelsonii]|uniref:Uncharacterized protein n=1 Tax=Candidatus Thiomargarita nelsonii TaxID=1003181 RepID=A0A0A6P5I3_9GAMM|nr:hypothetical protein PN36_22790 [Candidatus Thiomargarita nelsonii]